MRFKLTVFLLVANILTFGLILHESGKTEVAGSVSRSLFSAGISKIAVSGTTLGKGFLLELRKKDWFITEPYTWPANPFVVNPLLNDLRFLGDEGSFSVEEAKTAGSSLADYGLENPVLTLAVSDDAGTHTLKIGKETPDARGVYVLSPDGKQIILAKTSLLKNLSKKLDDFRSPEVFSMANYEVRSFAVRIEAKGGHEQRIGLARTRRESGNDGKIEYGWRLETPIAADAEAQKVEQRLKALTELKFKSFPVGDLALLEASGLKSPTMRFSFYGAMRSQSLLVGNVNPADKTELYAKLDGNDAIFTIPATAVESWNNVGATVAELREPRFLKFEPELLRAVKIHARENSLELYRTNSSASGTEAPKAVDTGAVELGSDASGMLGAVETPVPAVPASGDAIYAAWQMPVSTGSLVTSATTVDPAAIKQLVEELRNLRAVNMPVPANAKSSSAQRKLFQAFVTDNATDSDRKELGFDEPLRTVNLELDASPKNSEPARTIELAIAAPIAPGFPYHAKLENAIYTIDSKIVEALSIQPCDFRERTIYRMPANAKLLSIKLTDISGSPEKTVYAEECPKDVTDWMAHLALKNDVVSAETLALAKCVTHLDAEAFLPDAFSPNFKYDYLDSGRAETWRWKLEIEILPATSQKPEVHVYYLTKRLGGTFQLAGSPEQNCVFRMKQSFIDAIHKLTFARDFSKDIPEIPVPAPVENEPVQTVPAPIQ